MDAPAAMDRTPPNVTDRRTLSCGCALNRRAGTSFITLSLLALTASLTWSTPLWAQDMERQADQPVPVAPLEKWLTMQEVVAGEEPVVLHLRIGYERPLVFPEPVSVSSRAPLPATEVTVDAELVLFAPGGAFEDERLVFIGQTSARRYELIVSASRYGSRVPVRLVLP